MRELKIFVSLQSGKTGSAGVRLRFCREVKVTKKTLKFSLKTFGRKEINNYFCTRKYGSETDRKVASVKKRKNKDH